MKHVVLGFFALLLLVFAGRAAAMWWRRRRWAPGTAQVRAARFLRTGADISSDDWWVVDAQVRAVDGRSARGVSDPLGEPLARSAVDHQVPVWHDPDDLTRFTLVPPPSLRRLNGASVFVAAVWVVVVAVLVLVIVTAW